MSDTRKLSNDEVSALLDGLNDGVLDVGSGILPEKDYKNLYLELMILVFWAIFTHYGL